jgi:hypothetical protein
MRTVIPLGLALAAMLHSPSATLAAANIGVTSAVLPAARGTPPAEAARILQVGVDLQANERVETDAEGKAHLIFLDGSALTVGGNSDVTLDEYVYDPDTRLGKVSLSASRGVLRFVGGGISKKTPVIIRTPLATMGIRGGIAIVEVGAQVTATFLYGEELTVTGAGMTQRTDRPGYQIVVDQQGMPQEPRPAATDGLTVTLSALETAQASTAPGTPEMNDDDVADTMVTLLNSDAGLGELSTEAGGDSGAPPPPQPESNAEASQDAVVAVPPPANDPPPPANDPPPPLAETPPPSAPGAGDLPAAGPPGPIAPGEEQPGEELPPPVTIPVPFAGRIASPADAANPGGLGLIGGSLSGGTFQAQTADGRTLTLVETGVPGEVASTAQPYGAATLVGAGFAVTPGYLLFELRDQTNGLPAFAFAGQPTAAAQVPTSGLTTYPLRADFLAGTSLPFVDDVGPAGTAAGGRVHVAWDASAPGAMAAFGGGAVAIFGAGSAQQGAGVAFFGQVLADADGRPHLQGRTVGQRNAPASGFPQRYLGAISSSDAGDGSDLFGAGANFLLETSETDSSDTLQGSGLTRSTIGKTDQATLQRQHATGAGAAATGARSTRTVQGFAGGLERRLRNGAVLGYDTLTTGGAPTAELSTRADLNTVSGSFALQNGAGQTVDIALGDVAPTGRSAFIHDGVFFAGSGQILSGGVAVAGEYGLITSSELQHQGLVPAGVAFCACDYVTWGFLFGDRQAAPGSSEQRQTALASWVAGPLSSTSQLVGIAPQVATYSGHLIGGVVRNKDLYQAVGALSLSVRFGAGGFAVETAQVSSFDGANLAGGSAQTFGANGYSVDLAGAHPAAGAITGRLNGAFYGPGAPPANTAGDFTMTGTNFRSAGTFAAARP